MFEIHGDAMADHRLDLAQAPIRALRMAHEIAGSEQGVARFVEQVFVTSSYGYDSPSVTAGRATLPATLAYKAAIVILWRSQ